MSVRENGHCPRSLSGQKLLSKSHCRLLYQQIRAGSNQQRQTSKHEKAEDVTFPYSEKRQHERVKKVKRITNPTDPQQHSWTL